MPQLLVSFAALSAAEFLAKAQLISTSLAGNPNFPEPWPMQLATLAKMDAAIATYEAAYQAATGGDKVNIANRDAARATVTGMLKVLAPYLEIVAQGNDALLAGTGYDIRKPAVRSSGEALSAPSNFRLTRGEISGVLFVHAKVTPGAGSYQIQTATSDPTVDANWTDAGTFLRCSNIELDGLTPGKVYSVRMRAIGIAGPGAWTQAATLMVV